MIRQPTRPVLVAITQRTVTFYWLGPLILGSFFWLCTIPAWANESTPYLERAKALMERHGLKGVHPPLEVMDFLIHADKHRGRKFFTPGFIIGVTKTGVLFGSIPLYVPQDRGGTVTVPITVEIESPEVMAAFRGVGPAPGHVSFFCVLKVQGFSKDVGLPRLTEVECTK